jgi:hypothetical protein
VTTWTGLTIYFSWFSERERERERERESPTKTTKYCAVMINVIADPFCTKSSRF